MRYFPGARRRRRLAACAASALALGVLAVPLAPPIANALDGDDLRQQQRGVEKNLKATQADLEESSSKVRHATEAFDKAQARLATARKTLTRARSHLDGARERDRQMAERLRRAQDRLDTARTELTAGREAVEVQHQNVVDTVTSIYTDGDPQLEAFASLLNAESTEDLIRRSEIKDVFVDRQTRSYDDLDAAETLLAVREQEVQEATAQVADEREQAADNLDRTRTLRDQARTARADVVQLVSSRRDARQRARSARQHDLAALARLKRQDARIKKQILAAAAKDRSSGYSGRADGYLLPPVSGPVTSPFGYRIHPIYGYYGLHDGTDFGVSCGQGMRAVSSGTVVSRYYSSVYGNRLYLNVGRVNGHNITVVYNHATGYRVGVGQHVSRGEVVGYVGSTGWSTGCHLHFTVLQDGTAVDPMGYL